MSGPLPKADDQRRRRNMPAFEWRRLPASGRSDPPPPLPSGRAWSQSLIEEWAFWWSTPQATQWDQSGRSLHRWALLMDTILTVPTAPVSMHAQILAIEDRHGFSPAYMLKLRWLIVPDEPALVVSITSTKKRAAAKTKEDKDLLARMRAPR